MSWKKSWIIVNPKSRGGNTPELKKIIIKRAQTLGWQGKYYESSSVENAQDLIKKAAQAKISQVIIGGGDGTIRDLLKPVLQEKLTIGIIPLGTGNILARNLSIPLDTESAIPVALFGKIKKIDIGEANKNYFAVAAGMGIDVYAMEKTKKSSKNRLGFLAYIQTGIKSLKHNRKKYRILIDNKKEFSFRAHSILVANMANTVAGIELAPGAGPQSSSFKVVVINTRSISSWINLLINIFNGKIKNSPYYKLFSARLIKIYPLGGSEKFECDGDSMSSTNKLVVRLHSQLLKIRLPPSALNPRPKN